ncbi:phospholipase D family protein [Thermaurantiacus tibetensis]|uniref:phospholipase D family protein n=1 Tax=Thermaurantiacus tibetensis TaxID=2759035 RepID=UPI00188E5475|nr:phospholipase D family protein [Thermaurantiacus tibetensis]
MSAPWVALLAFAAAAALAWLWLRLASRLPAPDPRPKLGPPRPAASTALGQRFARACADHPGLSGVRPLLDPVESLAARVRLIRAAETSLDLQYYIWRGDIAGMLLVDELLAAARRGVQVRLLLDDNGIAGLDPLLKALDSHPRIEVRLFNPFVLRRAKLLGYLVDFDRLNRRMHNKALVADGTLAILGGRNIGDEYFGATDGALFADLDVMVAGPVVAELAADFERYWTCASAHAAGRILARVKPWPGPRIAARAAEARARPEAALYAPAFADRPGPGGLVDPEQFEWVPCLLVSDDPGKGLGLAGRDDYLDRQLLRVIGRPERLLGLVSPYFVPTKAGVAALVALARSGVEVAILTNAWEANNHRIVHTGYAPHRHALLAAGVRLFEAKRQRRVPRAASGGLLLGSARRWAPRNSLRSSGSALHAKTFTVDGRRLFVGSFNFDPRSLVLNTELGVVIESPALAGALEAEFRRGFPGAAYRVERAGRSLLWHEADGTVHRREPGTRLLDRLLIRLLAPLPIDWLL